MKTKAKHGLNLKPEETFLFERLTDVLRLEGAMTDIRQKYSQFWDGICRRVQGEHPELNCTCNHSIDHWAQVGIGRECWPSEYVQWPAGFYINEISFERLCSTASDVPSASVWLKPPKTMRVDFESLRDTMRRNAERQLKLQLQDEGGQKISFWFNLPESRQELLAMLTNQEEARFADRMVSHFGRLAKLIPMIDEVFKVKGKRGR